MGAAHGLRVYSWGTQQLLRRRHLPDAPGRIIAIDTVFSPPPPGSRVNAASSPYFRARPLPLPRAPAGCRAPGAGGPTARRLRDGGPVRVHREPAAGQPRRGLPVVPPAHRDGPRAALPDQPRPSRRPHHRGRGPLRPRRVSAHP
ncbi:hypothetical protein STCU_09988 [Strigomonas culicis]|uniref:Uncharacterized protein n=1 Tax=Strigomonas culicis TaxID=28005 RepID=S9V660_9TRYP|nr:hypothetical protein STCU_09988 [Strigomonas culicis]|eukprot:EPY18400.1 hypothetical protein STCU_09988 [Strigomonas culicis]